MDQSGLVSLMVELFVAIRLVSAYPVPVELPAVHRLSKTEIQRRLCDGRPCSIKAFYHPGRGVFVDEALDVHDNPFDRSVFLHELVHHLQKTTGKFEKVTSACSRRIAEEIEAYEIQNRYLSGAGTARRALFMGSAGRCTEDDQAFEPPPSLPAPNSPEN